MIKPEKSRQTFTTHATNSSINTSAYNQRLIRLAGNLATVALTLLLLFTFSCRSHRPPLQTHLEPLPTPIIKSKANKKYLSIISVNNHFDEFAFPANEQNLLVEFYNINGNHPMWLDDDRLNRNVQDLFVNIQNARTDGLNPLNYGVDEIEKQVNQITLLDDDDPTLPNLYARLDIVLSRAWFAYAEDLQNGIVDPAKFSSGWKKIKQQVNLPELLTKALKKHQIPQSFDELRPQDIQYNRLRNYLAQLIKTQENGGWPLPGFFETLETGDSSTHAVAVRKLLLATGDLQPKDTTNLSPLFDEELKMAVTSFQQRHGLKPDGIIGKNTQEAMNRSVDYRIKQLAVNLERMRWLPHLHDKEHIVVNIPEFVLRSYRNNKVKAQMNVVVGNVSNPTPILLNTIKYIVFNPTWNVPPSITRREMVTKMKSDSSYLEKNQYVLLKGSYVSRDTINPTDVDWANITADNFPYHVVQKPGRINALGKVKFLFPNDQNIYLHDTPSKSLFQQYERGYSHGCVRLQEPERLALHLLEKQMTEKELREIIASGKTTTVELRQKPIIYFVYQTTWVDDNQQINFRKDIYSFDEKMMEMLGEEPAMQSSRK
ncbi:MAG TPA: L,D-transpeptidase family protein [Bacteroidales bacterium]|nr:L,D-transpeptidase family protein [Bacteroidales bacterium]